MLSEVQAMIERASKNVEVKVNLNPSIGFISLNNGAGNTSILVEIAEYLSEQGSRVCIFDANLLQPNVAFFYDMVVPREKSIVRSFARNHGIKDYYIPVPNKQNLWLLSASSLDKPREIVSCTEDNIDAIFDVINKAFDYVLVDIPYEPAAEWFCFSVMNIDKGYITWDEQTDCAMKTMQLIDFVHSTLNKASIINNIILNKRTEWAYDLGVIQELECNLKAELPFLAEFNRLKTENKRFLKSGSADKKYVAGFAKLIEDIIQ